MTDITETDSQAWRPTHWHVQRGTEYEVLGEGCFQASMLPYADDLAVTVYRGEDGRLWARPTSEFNDGRFRPFLSNQGPEPGTRRHRLWAWWMAWKRRRYERSRALWSRAINRPPHWRVR